ncbi:ganglioside-induced differentiation-associated protein 2-like [Zingiber officinale]|uniref:ganglioside-induced differentiation-associated protein 2-like n=1 Tax=Zingiber officinale TaxID=94328 RepID=UPI001C4D603A|nr:ganglioside-induced differentiation-associated protein 2-like [Zingiber officinale]
MENVNWLTPFYSVKNVIKKLDEYVDDINANIEKLGTRSPVSKYVLPDENLRGRKVIHTVGPKYAVKYHTAAENSLSHCYRSCLEILIENGLQRIATGCIYTEAKNYPREPAAHVAIKIVKSIQALKDSPLCNVAIVHFQVFFSLTFACSGETVIDERKIRIKPLPAPSVADATPTTISLDLPISDVGLTLSLESYLDPTFMSLIKDPDQSRIEQQERVPKLKVISIVPSFLDGDLSGPPLSAAEE